MDRIQITKNINLDELIDPRTYFFMPDNGRSLIKMKVVKCIQLFRDKVKKPVYLNTWWSYYIANRETKTLEEIIKHIETAKDKKGRPIFRLWSGYRSPKCTIGAKASKHKKGEAGDLHVDGMTGAEMFKVVEDNAAEFYAMGVRRLEDAKDTPTWLHMDISESNHTPGYIRVIDPDEHIRDIKAVA